MDFYYLAFMELTTCRGTGYMTEGPISWTVIKQWADEYDVVGEQREDLFYHVQAMDSVYLDFKAKKLKAVEKRSKNGSVDQR